MTMISFANLFLKMRLKMFCLSIQAFILSFIRPAGTSFFDGTCWNIIEVVIANLFQDFHNVLLDVSRIITLFSKVADADRIKKFRPVCFLNCIYK
jgi:hypothetical protein